MYKTIISFKNEFKEEKEVLTKGIVEVLFEHDDYIIVDEEGFAKLILNGSEVSSIELNVLVDCEQGAADDNMGNVINVVDEDDNLIASVNTTKQNAIMKDGYKLVSWTEED